jgi:hypothetical protein
MRKQELDLLLREYGDEIPWGRLASIKRQLERLQEKGTAISEDYARAILENEAAQYIPSIRRLDKPVLKVCANCGNKFKTIEPMVKYCKNCIPKLREKRAKLSERRQNFRNKYRTDPEFAEKIKQYAKDYYRKPGIADKHKKYDKERRSDENWKIREKARLQKDSVKARRRMRERGRLKKPEVHARRLDSYRKYHDTDDYRKKNREREAARRKDPEKRPHILQLQRDRDARLRERLRAERDISRYFQNWHPGRLSETPEKLEQMIDPVLVAQRRKAEREQKTRENREKYLEEYNKRPGIKEHQQKYFGDYALRPEVIAKRNKKKEERELNRSIRSYFKKFHRVRRI